MLFCNVSSYIGLAPGDASTLGIFWTDEGFKKEIEIKHSYGKNDYNLQGSISQNLFLVPYSPKPYCLII